MQAVTAELVVLARDAQTLPLMRNEGVAYARIYAQPCIIFYN
jgi:hypothetical protein